MFGASAYGWVYSGQGYAGTIAPRNLVITLGPPESAWTVGAPTA